MMTEKDLESLRGIRRDATNAMEKKEYEEACACLCSLFLFMKKVVSNSDKLWVLRLLNPCKN